MLPQSVISEHVQEGGLASIVQPQEHQLPTLLPQPCTNQKTPGKEQRTLST